jgi:hypothetical protein
VPAGLACQIFIAQPVDMDSIPVCFSFLFNELVLSEKDLSDDFFEEDKWRRRWFCVRFWDGSFPLLKRKLFLNLCVFVVLFLF